MWGSLILLFLVSHPSVIPTNSPTCTSQVIDQGIGVHRIRLALEDPSTAETLINEVLKDGVHNKYLFKLIRNFLMGLEGSSLTANEKDRLWRLLGEGIKKRSGQFSFRITEEAGVAFKYTAPLGQLRIFPDGHMEFETKHSDENPGSTLHQSSGSFGRHGYPAFYIP